MKTKDNFITFLIENKNSLIGIFILSSIALIGFSIEKSLISIAVIGILISIIVLYNIKFGYYLTAFLLPFSINITIPQSSFTLNAPSEPLILILFLSTLYHISIGFKKELLTHPLSIIIAALVLTTFISVIFSDIPFISFKVWVKYFILIVTCFYGIFSIALKDFFFPIALLITHFGSFVIIAILNIVEHSTFNFHRSYAWDVPTPFYSDHAIYATTAAFVICIAFSLLLFYFKRLNLRFFIICASLLICFFAIYLTFSRAAWLSVIFAFGFYFAIKLKVKLYHIGIIMSILFVFAFLQSDDLFKSFKRNKSDSKKENTNLEDQFKSMSNVNNDVSNLERLNRWNAALRMIKERPFTGFGTGTYQFKYFPYQKTNEMTYISIRNPQVKYHAGEGGTTHSEYLLITSESGIIAGLLYISLLITSIILVLKRLHTEAIPVFEYYILVALGMSMITYLIHGGFNNYLDTDKISFLFYCTLAAIASIDCALRKPLLN